MAEEQKEFVVQSYLGMLPEDMRPPRPDDRFLQEKQAAQANTIRKMKAFSRMFKIAFEDMVLK